MMLLVPYIYTVNSIVCFALLVKHEEEQVLLHTIPSSLFSLLSNLLSLNLSHNALVGPFLRGILDAMPHLKQLDLSHNKMQTQDVDEMTVTTQSSSSSSSSRKRSPALTSLNLAYNLLSSLPARALLLLSPSLRSLDLRHNDLSTVSGLAPLGLLHGLTELGVVVGNPLEYAFVVCVEATGAVSR